MRVVHFLDGWEANDGRSRLLMLCRNRAQRQVGEDGFTTNLLWVTCPQCLEKADGGDSWEREGDQG